MKYWSDDTIERIRRGYYSAVYFNRTKYILEQEKNYKRVVMQVFQKDEGSILCGVEEVMELLRDGIGYWQSDRWISQIGDVTVESLKDGDTIRARETVMHIKGPYVYFAHLESLYLGILARRTLIATNTRKAVEAAKGKPVIFFADRFDHFQSQEGDGYAAKIGGAEGVSTKAHTAWIGGEPKGTIPHALIVVNDGDTILTTKQFAKYIRNVPVVALADFDNDCVKTSLEVAKALGKDLWGVRLDTPENMTDKSLLGSDLKGRRGLTFTSAKEELNGVNPTLVKLVRKSLDQEGFSVVKIIVSGGFDHKKIAWFEKEKTPVDVYGVGSALVHGENDFTADVVEVEGKRIAKTGRAYKPNKRLQRLS